MTTPTTSFKNDSGKTITPISGANTSDTSPKQGYEQTLTQLHFSDKSTVIATGSEGTLELPESQPIVNLLVSQPKTLFPVQSTSVGPDYDKSGWPKPMTPVHIENGQVDAMNQALTFRQNIMAAPSSKMAVDFQAALKQANSKTKVADMISTMNDFFANQSDYSKVTYPDYTAVQTYLSAFAQFWVQKNSASKSGDSGARYYVYSAPDATKKGAKSEGSILATRNSDAPEQASLTDPMSGYSLAFSSGSGENVKLTFADGNFSDGGPIQLNATYGYAGRFNGNISDVKLWPILVGTIQSKQVIAIPLSPESGWDKFWSSLSFQKLLSYFMEGMGLWMALDFLKTKLSSKKEKLDNDKEQNKGSEPTESQVQQAERDSSITGAADAEVNSSNGRAVSGDSSFDVPTTDSAMDSAVTNTRAVGTESMNSIAIDNTNGAIDSTGKTLEEMAEIETTPAMEAAGESLSKAGEAMSATPPDLDAAHTHLTEANVKLKEATTEMGDQISKEQKAAFEEQIKANEAAAEEAKEQEKESEDIKEGDEKPGEGIPVEE